MFGATKSHLGYTIHIQLKMIPNRNSETENGEIHSALQLRNLGECFGRSETLIKLKSFKLSNEILFQ